MRKKIGLLVVSIVILFAAAAVWYAYPFLTHEPDQQDMALLEEILEKEGIKDTDAGDVATAGDTTGESAAGENGMISDTSEGTSGKKLTPQEREKRIVAKYEGQCRALQGEFEGKLGALINAARKEYKGMGTDANSLDKLRLASKYVSLGNALEKSCDAEFAAIMNRMSHELQKAGISQNAVAKAKSAYAAQKSSRKKAVLGKAIN